MNKKLKQTEGMYKQMQSNEPDYSNIDLDMLKEVIGEYFRSKKPATFIKLTGEIGNTGVYRISDNCLGNKAAWDAFQEHLRKALKG